MSKTTKTITITLPITTLETLQSLPDRGEPQFAKFRGRKLSNICSLILIEQLEKLGAQILPQLPQDYSERIDEIFNINNDAQ
jgi:hypothetical protein